MQKTTPGARRRGRPRTAWIDNKTWTWLPVEESVRMTEDRHKWRKYVHGVARSWCGQLSDRGRLNNRTWITIRRYHCESDVGFLERRSVVSTVASDGDHFAVGIALAVDDAFDQYVLVLRGWASHHPQLGPDLIQLLLAHLRVTSHSPRLPRYSSISK